MKLLFVLFFIGVATAFPAEEVHKLMGAVDILVKEVLEYFRWLLKRHNPYSLYDVAEYDLVDDNINLKLSLSNLEISDASDFTIDKIATNIPNLQATFGVTFPAGQLDGNYKVSGTANNRNVQGSGKFSVNVNQWVQTGDIQFTIIDHKAQIEDINLDFKINGIKCDIQGLNIEGITEDEIKEFLNNNLLNELNQNRATVNQKVGKNLKVILNPVIKILSVKYFKMLVASTPDPLPLP